MRRTVPAQADQDANGTSSDVGSTALHHINKNPTNDAETAVEGGKDGRGKAAHKSRARIVTWSAIFCGIVFLSATYLRSGPSAREMKKAEKRRKRQDLFYQQHPIGGGGRLKTTTTREEMRTDGMTDGRGDILSGKLHLIDVHVPSSAVRPGQLTPYGANVRGVFCELNWAAHKADPSKVPMFKDLLNVSNNCKRTRITVPLGDIAVAARKVDREAAAAGSSVPRSIPPNAFVYHESRVGSTLVANSLAAFDPERNRVYSESSPLINAMKACGFLHGTGCDVAKSNAVIQDVVYMMGRTDDPDEDRLFFKIQSIGNTYNHNLRAAFPDTPWLFLYREPVQVMMSHLPPGRRNMEGAVCLRTKRSPPQLLKELVKNRSSDGRSYKDISLYEACAAHLAYLCESAITEHTKSGTGRMVNYAKLPDMLLDDIIPNYFGLPVGEPQRQRVFDVAKNYSKGRQNSKTWKDDTQIKEDAASPKVRSAATEFLAESYRTLEQFSVTPSTGTGDHS